MTQTKHTKGFTLVELMLAMTFLSVLLLAIAALIIQVTNIYTKGVTLNAVDRAGQAISSEVQRALNQSSASKVSFVTSGDDGGRLCTGSATYVWNYGQAITGTGPNFSDANKYTDNTKDIRFIKVEDADGELCTRDGDGRLPFISKANARELLQGTDRNVVLHDVSLYAENVATSAQTLYSVSVEIGTNNSGESNVINGQTQCKPPLEGYDEFCAVNRFAFTARSGNQDKTGASNE